MRPVDVDEDVLLEARDSPTAYLIDSPIGGDTDLWLIRPGKDVEKVYDSVRYHYRSGDFDGLVQARSLGTDDEGDIQTYALRPVFNHRDVAHVDPEPNLPEGTLRLVETLAEIPNPSVDEARHDAEADEQTDEETDEETVDAEDIPPFEGPGQT